MPNELGPSTRTSQEVHLLEQEIASLRLALEQERANAAKQQAERESVIQLLGAAVEQCPVPMLIVTATDLVGKYINRAALDVLGVPEGHRHVEATLSELMEASRWRLVRQDGTPIPLSELPMLRALRGETVRDEEAILVRADGSTRCASVSAMPMRDNGGVLVAGLLVLRDDTQRKETEAAIRTAQERLDLALDGANLGIWDWNVATGVVSYDYRWAGMLGYAREELEPNYQSWADLVHPEDMPRIRSIINAHLEGATQALEFEHRLRHHDGSWVWVLSKGRVCERNSDGKPLRVVGTHVDITQRKQQELARLAAERDARQRAEETESLMKSMSNAFVVWRTELDEQRVLKNLYFEFCNDAYERAAGLTWEQLRGRSLRDVWPETEQSWFDVYGEVASTGVAKSFEMYHAPTQGYYACNAYRPPNLADRICVVFEDVTERKRNLRSLEEVAGQQRAILNAVPVGICFVKERHFQWVNRELARMFGYEIEEVCGAPVSKLYMHEYDFERVGRDGYARIATGAVYSTEVLFKKKDGTPTWCHLTGQAVDIHDPAKGSIWNLSDITERRTAEIALRESELRFKRLVQNSSDIIAVTDSAGSFLSVSDSVVRILGYQPAELVSANQHDFVHPDDREGMVRFFSDIVLTPDAPVRAEYRHRHKNGEWIPLELVGTNLLCDPSVKGVVHNLRDISERNRLNEQLQQAMKMEAVGRLAGGIAHDFNNLLTVISGNLELLKMDVEATDSVRALVADASAASRSAAALTRQLLAFSRRQMIEPRVLDLNELVKELQKLLVRIIGEDIGLETSLTENIGAVRVDPGQFEQVVVNLVVNARDAMPHGGKLILETGNVELDGSYQRLHPDVIPGQYVLLAVSDTGVGMDVHVKQRLFEPFFTTKPRGRGTGLGLATIFGVVKQAGGSIEVYSELGKGSTFKVYLPRVNAAPESFAIREAMPNLPRGTETVLLVEDEDNVRNLSQAVLQRLGYSVMAASSASEALTLAKARSEPIQLLMTDVVMPAMNGRELAQELVSIHPETKVLYTSGYTEDVIVYHGVVDENASFIGKPFTVQSLALKIREVLDGRNTDALRLCPTEPDTSG